MTSDRLSNGCVAAGSHITRRCSAASSAIASRRQRVRPAPGAPLTSSGRPARAAATRAATGDSSPSQGSSRRRPGGAVSPRKSAIASAAERGRSPG